MHTSVPMDTSHQLDCTTEPPPQAGLYVWGIAFSAALGGLLFGYDWVVIGGAREFYEAYFHLASPALIGWVNSCALVGCLAGSLAAGTLAKRSGRRPVLIASAILFAASSALTGWSFSVQAFVLWRIVGGVAIGLASNVSPLYIAEISPAPIRGRLVSFNQFAIVTGILLAQIVNWSIARPVRQGSDAAAIWSTWNVQHGWRWMFTIIVLPSVVFMVASLLLPESPRWLAAQQRHKEAENVLRKIGGPSYAANELDRMEANDRRTRIAARSAWAELFQAPVRRLVLIGIALAVLQQWTGINTLFNYASDVYRSAGYGSNDILLNIIVTGVINVTFTLLAMVLVDRVGRRVLMLLGCLGISASHLLCALAYRQHWRAGVVLLLTLSAIACYALTLAPLTWVLISEIFPNRIRAQAISVAVSALWVASFLLTYSFPSLENSLGPKGVFAAYGAICLTGFLFVFFAVPETKGGSLEDLERSLSRV